MIKIDMHTKGIFLAGFITWCITFSGAWITYTNTITKLETNQTTLMNDKVKVSEALSKLSDKVGENTKNAAVSTSALVNLNATLVKIDKSLDIIANESTKNAVRLDNLERRD